METMMTVVGSGPLVNCDGPRAAAAAAKEQTLVNKTSSSSSSSSSSRLHSKFKPATSVVPSRVGVFWGNEKRAWDCFGKQFVFRKGLKTGVQRHPLTPSKLAIGRFPKGVTTTVMELFCKTDTEHCGAIFEDVPHVTDWLPDLQTYPNPLKFNPAYSAVKQYFVENDAVVTKDAVVKMTTPWEGIHFRRAGPREKIYFRPEEVKACIVTCGGLCPGINTVIREIVCSLWFQYGVRDIIGIVGGYRGFYARNTQTLNPKVVNDIHKRGGTILGTSRGGHDTMKIVDSIEDRDINQVYIIGGDGTHRGADLIYQEIKRRGLKVAVACIPKTIDNDIDIIDKSFGFDTAVEEAQRAINAAHVEAESADNGIGVVKLMGRYSGSIALYATLASRDVDCCMIPEAPFYLEGAGGLFEFVYRRLRENGHVVLVVAEGAGQDLVAQTLQSNELIDASGNQLLRDIGHWLSQQMKEHFSKLYKEPVTLKYIDPTYMIRAIPGNAADNVYCTLLAHSVIHGAMAGFTGFTAGPVNNRHCYIPIARAVETQRLVNVSDRMWARLLSSTNQPSFFHDKDLQKRNVMIQTENGDDFTEEEYETNGDSEVNGYTDNGSENLNTEDAEQPALVTTIPPADPNVSQNNHAP
ncbi:unnamed protein product [Sphagnum troendelagicum]|uniref:ATP-dependent 6-phosphofructokinase n=1 Tax=Sphagnum troendelagicum TaxID=128251 RepID=A0ABP0UWW0_9BRYO